jgi:small subunit ribosomal protein S16
MGANKRPFYRVVVADQRSPRDGRFIEVIGKYHPLEDPSLIEIDRERAMHWLRTGAQPSEPVMVLLRRSGIWDEFVAERPSAAGRIAGPARERPARARVSKKAAAKAAAAEPEPSVAELAEEAEEAPVAREEPVAEEAASPDRAPEAPGDEATADEEPAAE